MLERHELADPEIAEGDLVLYPRVEDFPHLWIPIPRADFIDDVDHWAVATAGSLEVDSAEAPEFLALLALTLSRVAQDPTTVDGAARALFVVPDGSDAAVVEFVFVEPVGEARAALSSYVSGWRPDDSADLGRCVEEFDEAGIHGIESFQAVLRGEPAAGHVGSVLTVAVRREVAGQGLVDVIAITGGEAIDVTAMARMPLRFLLTGSEFDQLWVPVGENEIAQ